MKITILSLFLLLVLSGISHSGIVVVPVEPAPGEETNLERYRKYKGESPLELWREKQRVKKYKMNQQQKVRPDVEPLKLRPYTINTNPSKFHIKFRINH